MAFKYSCNSSFPKCFQACGGRVIAFQIFTFNWKNVPLFKMNVSHQRLIATP